MRISINAIVENINNFIFRKRKRVLITGFGPFRTFNPNPSWQAVKAIDARNITKNGREIILFKEKVNVHYEYVNQTVHKLLDTKKPHLIIHVGVAEEVTCLRLEKQAYKDGYKGRRRQDVYYTLPTHGVNPSPGDKCYATCFDIEALQKEYNKLKAGDLKAETSHDAGRFLCEYIYYTSLSYEDQNGDRIPTLFVHVPPNVNCDQLARGLELITQLCLQQMQLCQCVWADSVCAAEQSEAVLL